MDTVLSVFSYETALAFLESLDVSAMKLGLERVTRLLDTLGNPQDMLPMVHIAGTNGKGSTAAMLTSVLTAAGYRVGTFISPHLVDIRERICLNGQMISQTDFTQSVAELAQHLQALGWERDDWPTYFEFLNVLAYRYFQQQGTDITVFETGLGGRLDSTNVVKHPNVCIITTIGLDHVERLGGTIKAIASEKAGIIKPQVPIVVGPSLPPNAMAVIQEKASREQAPILLTETDFLQPINTPFAEGQILYDTQAQIEWRLPLMGLHQRENLTTVLKTIEELCRQGFKISQPAIAKGLQETQWPGRLQFFPEQRMILDGSHNPQGFETLKASLQQYFPNTPLYWILSLRANRAVEQLLEVVNAFPQTKGIFWTQGGKTFLYHDPTQMQTVTLAARQSDYWVEAISSPQEALSRLQALLLKEPEALGIATGSLYTVGALLDALSLPSPMSTRPSVCR